MDQEHLLVLINSLRSSENAVRKGAEEQYNALASQNSSWMMHALSEVSAKSQDAGVVTMSLILLRKLLNETPSPYKDADDDTREAIKGCMLEALTSAAFGSQRGSAAACVSALAVQVFQLKQDWSQLWESVFQILTAVDAAVELKTVCCEIVMATCISMTSYFQSHIDSLVNGLQVCFQAPNATKELKSAAFETAVKLSVLNASDKIRPLVPVMLNVIQEYLNAQDWDAVETLISSTVDGISTNIDLFQQHATQLLTGMMQVASSQEVSSGARYMAIEMMLTYCEEVPRTVRQVPQFATSFFELLFQYTLNPEYPEEWGVTGRVNDENDLEENTDCVIGSTGLDRISNALGGRKLQRTAQQLFMDNINSADWKHRNAAVLLICYVGEGMQAVFSEMLPTIVPAIAPYLKDESMYVRANTLDCIAQLSMDFAPQMQMTMHAVVLPSIVDALRDPVPHVAACAANCLDTFIDSVGNDDDEEDDDGDEVKKFCVILQPYLKRICEDCVTLLQSTSYNFLREAVLGVLSAVSSTCKSLLEPFVTDLVPIYQQVLAIPDTPEVMTMKCKAIECVTLLACGVGRDAFSAYAFDVCNYLGQLCTGGLSNDDRRTRFVMRGWTCMVECLKDQVQPYLPTIIPILLSMIGLECDMEIANVGVGDDDDDTESVEGVEKMRFVIPGVGERLVTVHTSLVEDKELASNVLLSMVKDLGPILAPYFRDIANASIPLLTFVVSDSIRESGAMLISEILECYMEAQAPEAAQLVEATMPPLMEALGDESENSVMEQMMRTVGHCITAHPHILSEANATMICEKLMAAIKVVVKGRDECLEKKKTENDEDELDGLEVQDEELQETISSACELIGAMLSSPNPAFAGLLFAQVREMLTQWMQPTADDFYTTRGCSILCEYVSKAPQAITEFLQLTCAFTLHVASQRRDADLLQSNFFLIHCIVELLGQHPENSSGVDAADYAVHAQQALAAYWSSPAPKSGEYDHCTCNALSAYVSLLNYYGTSALQNVSASMLSVVVEALPASNDEVEACRIHDTTLGWIVNQHPVLAVVPGSAAMILPRLKAANAECLSAHAKQTLASM